MQATSLWQTDGPDRKLRVYRFGEVRVDLARFEVRVGDRRLEVQPRVFDLIVHLIENRDRVVTRGELLDVVWCGRTVTPASVSVAVWQARKAVGDDATRQTVIRTVPRRGYRFVADLRSGP